MLSMKEASKYLGVSEHSVRKYMLNKTLKVYVNSCGTTKYSFKPEDLDAFLKTHSDLIEQAKMYSQRHTRVDKPVDTKQPHWRPCPLCEDPMSNHRKVCLACSGKSLKDRCAVGTKITVEVTSDVPR